MIVFLYFAVSLYIPFVRASLSSFNGTTSPTVDAINFSSSNNTRSLWDIIWSCAATLFACTWTAIHPNIPGLNDGKVATTSRRLFIMVMAMIAPELMITWSARQFFSARKAAKDFNDAYGAQRADHQRIGEENTATLLTLPLDERNNASSSALQTAHLKFTGRLHAWTLCSIVTDVQPMVTQDGQSHTGSSLGWVDSCSTSMAGHEPL